MTPNDKLLPNEREELAALRRFRSSVVAASQNVLVDGREMSGAEFISAMSDCVLDHLKAQGLPVYVAVGDLGQPGYWNNDEGWSHCPDYQHVAVDPKAFEGLQELICVIQVPPDKIGDIDLMPSLDSVEDIARQVLDEASAEGVVLDGPGAADRMARAYKASTPDCYIPDDLATALGGYLAVVRDKQIARERECVNG